MFGKRKASADGATVSTAASTVASTAASTVASTAASTVASTAASDANNVTRKRKSAWGPNKSTSNAKKVKSKKSVDSKSNRVTRRKTQQQIHILNNVCGTIGTDLCLSLSTYREDMLTLFDRFIYFNNVSEDIYRLGRPSANGFIRKVVYKVRDIISYAILKSSASEYADNLAYEYRVGLFLNIYRTIFPCFVQTYGLYYYKTENFWIFMKDNLKVRADTMRKSLLLQTPEQANNYSQICKRSKHAAILIEDIASKASLGHYLKFHQDELQYFATYNLVYILYQIYFPLAALCDRFTHYDLHTNNVMIYEPHPGKYITYHYHLSHDTEVTFNSTLVAKIIDYGRSYYKEDDANNSRVFYNKLCETSECTDTRVTDKYIRRGRGFVLEEKIEEIPCGDAFGFKTMSQYMKDNFQICSYERNASHDLRLLTIVRSAVLPNIGNILELAEFATMLSQVRYGEGVIPGNEAYGTEENLTVDLNIINNVLQAEEKLRHILRQDTDLQRLNATKYNNIDNKLGDLHIYSDGTPMHFEINISRRRSI